MNKQCGSCRWWDRENIQTQHNYGLALCLYPIPPLPDALCVEDIPLLMASDDGQDCQVYDEWCNG